MSACLSDILLKVLNGSLIKIKPICYVTVAPITLCFMIDDCGTKIKTLILLLLPPTPAQVAIRTLLYKLASKSTGKNFVTKVCYFYL